MAECLSPHTAPEISTTDFGEVPSQLYCNSIIKLPQSWSLKYFFSIKTIFNIMKKLTKRWLLQFSSYFPSAVLQHSKEDWNFKIKMEIKFSKAESCFLFLQWLPTAKTLPRFQDYTFFKAEAKKSSSRGGEKNQNYKVENQLLSRFLILYFFILHHAL